MAIKNVQNYLSNYFTTDDPPVPQGATKFSYSARISNCKILICDVGLDYLEVKVIFFINYNLIIGIFFL